MTMCPMRPMRTAHAFFSTVPRNAPRILAPSLRQQRLDDALRTPHTRSTLAAVEGQLPRSTSTDDFLLKVRSGWQMVDGPWMGVDGSD